MYTVLQQVGGLMMYVPFVMGLCLGLVEAAKRAGVRGQASLAVSMGVGAFFGMLSYLAEFGVPAGFAGWFAALAFGVLIGLATSGIYDFATGRLADQKEPVETTGTTAEAVSIEMPVQKK